MSYQSETMSRAFYAALYSYIDAHQNLRNPLILVSISNQTFWMSDQTMKSNLRFNEKETVSIALRPVTYLYNGKKTISNQTSYLVAVFDSRSNSRLLAGLSLGRTFFVCVILTLGSILFRKDASDVIIGPLLVMIEKIRRIADNPLEAASREDKEALDKEKMEEEEKKAGSTRQSQCVQAIVSCCRNEKDENGEKTKDGKDTMMLE